ncbi:hypothetical protein MHH81_21165 [Psychrobacillus sp. FSL H8-0484]|uniref:hypothetical protein n=1 Tax=Psychrobacillus sp. FSL H8-0484 TaxID=2921390 RepID=UPI0030F5B69D
MEEGHAESELAYIALHYINYFGEEIDKLELTEDFKELQIITYKINYNFTFNIQNEGFEKQQETFITEFTTKLNEIYCKRGEISFVFFCRHKLLIPHNKGV